MLSTAASELEDLLEQEAIARARENLLAFVLYTMPTFEANWHHRLFCEKLERFVRGEIPRLLIETPPRHGKSQLVSRHLPAFIFGRNPCANIISCSYSADLASMMNRDVQRIIDSPAYARLFPETKLGSSNARTTGAWQRNADLFEIVKHGGTYRSAGVGGGITGMGGSPVAGGSYCIARGQRVLTKNGWCPIEQVHAGDLVLTHRGRWRAVIATADNGVRPVLRLSVNGGSLVCTNDHRLLTPRGWCDAKDSRIVFAADVQELWDSVRSKKGSEGRTGISKVLFSGLLYASATPRRIGPTDCADVQKLWGFVRPQAAPAHTTGSSALLFEGMSARGSTFGGFGEAAEVRTVWQNGRQKQKTFLLNEMSRRIRRGARGSPPFAGSCLSELRTNVSPKIDGERLLFDGVQKRGARPGDAGGFESELSRRVVDRGAFQSLSQEDIQKDARPIQNVRGVWIEVSSSRAPYRRSETERFTQQPGGALSPMPYGVAQIEKCGEARVYDLQVEEDRSFVVEGFIAHNCIIDDPIKNADEANSPTYRDKLFGWYATTLRPRVIGNPNGILLTLTRWHEDDLAGRLLEYAEKDREAEQWEVLCLPAIKEGLPTADDPRAEGEALWANRFTVEHLRAVKATIPGAAWTSLYQQRPSAPEGSIIKRDWLRYYDTLPDTIDRWWQSWDLTFDETEAGSYVVGQVWAQTGANCYLVHQYRDRVDFSASVAQVENVTKAYPMALRKKVEKKANGAALLSVLKNKVQGLVPVTPLGDKPRRLMAVSPLFEAGNIWLPKRENAPWVGEYIEELVTFPKSKYDDQVDATSQALVDIQKSRMLEVVIPMQAGLGGGGWRQFG